MIAKKAFMEQQISLYFKNDSSDKEYHAQLKKVEQGSKDLR